MGGAVVCGALTFGRTIWLARAHANAPNKESDQLASLLLVGLRAPHPLAGWAGVLAKPGRQRAPKERQLAPFGSVRFGSASRALLFVFIARPLTN